ncbi:MAG: alpha/beta hydrolase [Candidatus Sericytochromatia bacterium]
MPRILLLLLALLLNGCALLELQRAHQELEISDDVAYFSDQNPRHRLDIIMPRGAKRVPVVFFVHGGYWNSQDKAYYRPFTGLYANVGLALARRGIGTVIADYRIYPEVGIEGELEDLSRALRWTQERIWRYGGDPRSLVLAGHSAGGHMVALLGLEGERLRAAGVETDWIRGLVPMSPILDLAHMEKFQDAGFNASTTYPVFGREPANWEKYSPVSYFRKPMPPMFVLYGEKDFDYLVAQNQLARTRLQQLGAPAEYLVVPGYRHEDMVLRFGLPDDPIIPALADFVFRVTGG